jgi:hypothetical protein
MTVRDLIPQLLALGEGHAGCGPDHPDTPAPQLLSRLEAFLAEHPGLRRDRSYVEFLRTYAGASLEVPDQYDTRWFAFLPSLIEGDPELVPFTEEGYRVDPDGYLCVAQLFHQVSKVQLEFGYYVAAEGPSGLYRTILPPDGSKARDWYRASFAEWLERFVELGEAIFEESPGPS